MTSASELTAIGYAPVDLDAAGTDPTSGSLGLIARLRQQGCSSILIDDVSGQALRDRDRSRGGAHRIRSGSSRPAQTVTRL